MNLHQFRFVREAVKQNYNLTEVAKVLYTSQPGISKAIIELEEELGIDIFIRHGKRIRGLTKPGRIILQSVELIMQELKTLKRIGAEFAAYDHGNFTIATTHTQARYFLPKVVQAFTKKYPKVQLSLLQGNPKQIIEMVRNDEADIAIATEAMPSNNGLVSLPCYQWENVVIVPPKHPLLMLQHLSLEEIAHYPLITYSTAFTNRNKVDQAFSMNKLKPDIILEAIDADIIKTYVKLGMGVGIIASIAFNDQHDCGLRAISAAHLFGVNNLRLTLKHSTYLRNYIYTFIELLSPTLNRKFVAQVIKNKKDLYFISE